MIKDKEAAKKMDDIKGNIMDHSDCKTQNGFPWSIILQINDGMETTSGKPPWSNISEKLNFKYPQFKIKYNYKGKSTSRPKRDDHNKEDQF